jgi:hypothetical protein
MSWWTGRTQVCNGNKGGKTEGVTEKKWEDEVRRKCEKHGGVYGRKTDDDGTKPGRNKDWETEGKDQRTQANHPRV